MPRFGFRTPHFFNVPDEAFLRNGGNFVGQLDYGDLVDNRAASRFDGDHVSLFQGAFHQMGRYDSQAQVVLERLPGEDSTLSFRSPQEANRRASVPAESAE